MFFKNGIDILKYFFCRIFCKLTELFDVILACTVSHKHNKLRVASVVCSFIHCKLNFSIYSTAAIVCCRISADIFWMRRFIVLFDNGSIANLLATASPLIILAHFDGCWFNQVFSSCMSRFSSNNFQSNSKSLHSSTTGVGNSTPSSWTINTTSLHMKLFILEKIAAFINVFCMKCLKMPSQFRFFQITVS